MERTLGWTAESVRHPKKLAPEEGSIDTERFMPQKGPRRLFLPKRWIVGRLLPWLSQNMRMSKKDYERLPESGEAFIYAAMSRLMVRRLARS